MKEVFICTMYIQFNLTQKSISYTKKATCDPNHQQIKSYYTWKFPKKKRYILNCWTWHWLWLNLGGNGKGGPKPPTDHWSHHIHDMRLKVHKTLFLKETRKKIVVLFYFTEIKKIVKWKTMSMLDPRDQSKWTALGFGSDSQCLHE